MRLSKKSAWVRRILWYFVACLITVITVYPFLWTVATSFKSTTEIYTNPMSLFPGEPTLENYIHTTTTVPFWQYFKNSFGIAFAGVFTNVFFGALAGYSFAKIKFKGRKMVFTVLLASMMIPGIVTMVPQFVVMRRFPLIGGNDLFGQGGSGFINSPWAVILQNAVGPFAIFFMRAFFQTLPDELAEAGRIDGCREFQIFLRIYLPLIVPAVLTLGIMTFQAGWNNFIWPMIVLNDSAKYTVQIGLSMFRDDKTMNYGATMAGTLISTIPILLLFIFAQRYFVEGIAFSGSKS